VGQRIEDTVAQAVEEILAEGGPGVRVAANRGTRVGEALTGPGRHVTQHGERFVPVRGVAVVVPERAPDGRRRAPE
jgi:hypothetical protein